MQELPIDRIRSLTVGAAKGARRIDVPLVLVGDRLAAPRLRDDMTDARDVLDVDQWVDEDKERAVRLAVRQPLPIELASVLRQIKLKHLDDLKGADWYTQLEFSVEIAMRFLLHPTTGAQVYGPADRDALLQEPLDSFLGSVMFAAMHLLGVREGDLGKG